MIAYDSYPGFIKMTAANHVLIHGPQCRHSLAFSNSGNSKKKSTIKKDFHQIYYADLDIPKS